MMSALGKEPINLIITGVGGQGNIVTSRLLGQAFIQEGYTITIGETYGATQRGGSVASHFRISREGMLYSPVTPRGKADIILGLEPSESLRILTNFGYPGTYVVTNTRPIYPLEVAAGEAEYPTPDTLSRYIGELSRKAWHINATEIAIGLGNPLLTNIVMTGALIGTGLVPLERAAIGRQLRLSFRDEQLAANREAFDRGYGAVGG